VTASAGNPVTVHGPDSAAPGPRRARLAGGAAWMPLIPALVTLAIALYQIQRPSLWRDEGATLAAIRRSLPQLVSMLGHQDVVHGAYYVFIWFETRVAGTSALALRFPSAVGMAVAAALTAALGRRLVSTWAGLAAGLVIAVLPSVTWYAQNARSYALVTTLAATASYLLVRAMEAPAGHRRGWLTGYGAALAAMGLGNIFALLLIPAHALTLALALRARSDPPAETSDAAVPALAGGGPLVRGWLAAAAAGVLVASPVIAISAGQQSQVSWIPPLGRALFASLLKLFDPPELAVGLLVVMLATFAFSALRGRLRTDFPSSLLALTLPWLLLPPTVLLTASAVHPVFSARYVLICLPAAALLAGVGLASLGRAGAVAGLVLIVLLALPGQISDRKVNSHSRNLRQLSHLVAVHSRPGDALLFPHLNDHGFEAAYPARYRSLRDVGLGQTPVQSATLFGTNAPASVIRRRLSTTTRLWVIETSSERGRIPLLTGLGFHPVHRWTVTGIWLVLYTRPS
jgi:mannosyltransferase